MAKQGPTKPKLYLYAVIPESNGLSFGAIGLNGGTV